MNGRNTILDLSCLFLAAVALTACHEPLVSEIPDAPTPEPTSLERPSYEGEPTYVVNAGYDRKWYEILRSGIDISRAYLGNHGPVQVYVFGQESNELENQEEVQRVVSILCERRHRDTTQYISGCEQGDGLDLIKRTREGSIEAFLSYIDYTKPGLCELIFLNPHKFGDPDLHTRAIHEYTHVYQMAYPYTPTWIREGSAEFLAFYLGEVNGWADFYQNMAWMMESYRTVHDTGFGIQDMEEIDRAKEEVKQYHRQLGYDAGSWAIAYLIHKSPSRSIRVFSTEFFPLVRKEGWEKAVALYANMEDKQAFYDEFALFLSRPLEQQMPLLLTLKD